jgi:hypothetical protein
MSGTSKPKRAIVSEALLAIYLFERGDGTELAKLLRKAWPPAGARKFFADVVERMKPIPPHDQKGGRPRSKFLTDASLRALLVSRYEAARRRHARLAKVGTAKRMIGDPTPHELALEDVAARYGVKAAVIAKIITASRKKPK